MQGEVGSAKVVIKPSMTGFKSQVGREVDSAGQAAGGKFSSAFKGAVGGIAAAVAAVGITSFFVSGVKGASELEQSVGAVSAIFKDSAGQINQWAGSAATDVGLTKNEFNELGTLIGAQLKNGGTAMDELAPKTNDLITLGADLASMFGGDTKSAVSALSSALKGERDPIEAYGVSLSQAKIDAEAAALGFKKVGGSLSAEANQAATLSLIMKQTADAHGNFGRESDTLAGKQQRLSALWRDGKTAIASAFLPAISAITGWFVTKLPGAIDTTLRAGQTVVDFFSYVGGYMSGEGSNVDIGWLEKPAERVAIIGIWLQNKGALIRDTIAFIAGYVSGEGANVDIGWLEKPAERIADSIIGIKEAFSNGNLGASFGTFLAAARPAGPVLVAVAEGIASMSELIADLVTATLPVLPPLLMAATSAMSLLTSNSALLKAVLIGIVAAYATYRGAMIASNAVLAISNTVTGIRNAGLAVGAARTAIFGSATVASTAATATDTAAVATNTAARNAGILANVRAATSTIAARVAMVAGAVATGIATAAQWALNAAMSANPIALVVIAIAALVAGLIWFFTQTELGRTIWAGFVAFLGEAWNNIVAAITLTLQILSQVFQAVWAAIVSFVTGYITGVAQTILRVMAGISSAWNAGWSAISSFFSSVWNGILSFVRGVATGVQGAVAGLVSAVQSKVGEAVSFVSQLPGKAVAAMGEVRSKLFSSGQSLVQGWIDGIKSMIGAVGSAVSNVVQGALNFFPNSPAKEGPLSGSGWRNLKASGGAVIDQWGSGFPDGSLSLAGTVSRSVQNTVGALNGSAAGGSVGPSINYYGDFTTQDAPEFFRQQRREMKQARAGALNGARRVRVAT